MGKRDISPYPHFNTGVVTVNSALSFHAQTLANLRFRAETCREVHREHYTRRLGIYAGMLIQECCATFCPPPVVNDKAVSVTAPAASGQGVGSSMSVSRTSTHLKPSGVSICFDVAQPLALVSSRLSVPNTSTAARTMPIAATPQMPQKVKSFTTIVRPPVKKSNLDLTGMHLVKRGSLVSWHGHRFVVSKVRMGIVYPRQYSLSPILLGLRFLDCESVQVVS